MGEQGSASTQRIAVVFVHGQGEQSPMTDLQELARSVWTTDPNVGEGAPLHSEPLDDREGSDQRRLVGRAKDREVHFYQFYWADLMRGNKFTHLWSWFSHLMKRAPNEVPAPLWPIRQIAMIGALVIAVWGGALGVAAGGRGITAPGCATLHQLMAWAADNRGALGQCLLGALLLIPGIVLAAFRPKQTSWGLPTAIAASIFWVAGLSIGGAGVIHALSPTDLTGNLAALWRGLLLLVGGGLFVLAAWPRRRAFALTLGLAVGLAAIPTWFLSPQPKDDLAGPVLMTLSIVALAVLVVVGCWLNKSFLAPVMTDSARMFDGQPVNIGNQNAVRRRGLDLMAYLHDPDRSGGYDRIVVLAHSLGTVVAYRVLAHYWGSVCGRNPTLDPDTAAALAAAGEAAPEAPDAWRGAVRDAFSTLQKASGPSAAVWRISDFVTIGSPLTYAHLLFEDRDLLFEHQVQKMLRYPTSPPQSDALADSRAHGGMFNVMNWTNLFFPPVGIAGGDMVGGRIAGPLPQRLGEGVKDIDLGQDPAARRFAHNEYWKFGDEAKDYDPFEKAPSPTPLRIIRLREALGIL